jgi:hypothetical protein
MLAHTSEGALVGHTRVSTSQDVVVVTSTPAGSLVAIGRSTGVVDVINLDARGLYSVISEAVLESAVVSLAFSANGQYLIALFAGVEHALVLDTHHQLRKVGQFIVPGRPLSVAIAPRTTAGSTEVLVTSQMGETSTTLTTALLPAAITPAHYVQHAHPPYLFHDHQISRRLYSVPEVVSAVYASQDAAVWYALSSTAILHLRADESRLTVTSSHAPPSMAPQALTPSPALGVVVQRRTDGSVASFFNSIGGVTPAPAQYAHAHEGGGVTAACVSADGKLYVCKYWQH